MMAGAAGPARTCHEAGSPCRMSWAPAPSTRCRARLSASAWASSRTCGSMVAATLAGKRALLVLDDRDEVDVRREAAREILGERQCPRGVLRAVMRDHEAGDEIWVRSDTVGPDDHDGNRRHGHDSTDDCPEPARPGRADALTRKHDASCLAADRHLRYPLRRIAGLHELLDPQGWSDRGQLSSRTVEVGTRRRFRRLPQLIRGEHDVAHRAAQRTAPRERPGEE